MLVTQISLLSSRIAKISETLNQGPGTPKVSPGPLVFFTTNSSNLFPLLYYDYLIVVEKQSFFKKKLTTEKASFSSYQ